MIAWILVAAWLVWVLSEPFVRLALSIDLPPIVRIPVALVLAVGAGLLWSRAAALDARAARADEFLRATQGETRDST